MATSTLVQFLEAGEPASTSNRRQTETFIAGAAITAGDWVQVDTSQTGVNKVLFAIQASAAFANGNPLVVGVALTAAAAAGDTVEVCIAGFVESANVAAAVNAPGIALVVDNTSAGRAVALAAADTAGACGVSLAAASVGNVGSVLVYKQF